MQSIASRSLPDEEILYQKKKITVTPSWLEIKNTSYSVRCIQKLTLNSSSPPRIAAGMVFVIAFGLALWQAYRVINEIAPITLNWTLLILCVLLMLVSSFVAFVMPVRYRLDIILTNEPRPLQIDRITRADTLELHEALALAMDWYRGEADLSPRRKPETIETTQ